MRMGSAAGALARRSLSRSWRPGQCTPPCRWSSPHTCRVFPSVLGAGDAREEEGDFLPVHGETRSGLRFPYLDTRFLQTC